MEPEVVTWLDTLTFAQYQRVMRNVDDYLVDRGDILDGDHTKALRDGVRELRLYLGRQRGGSHIGCRPPAAA